MSEGLKRVGKYRLVRKIGAGATSEVYEGRKDGSLQRFAIKMIKIKAMSAEHRENITKQVLFIKGIEHPNIVQLHESLSTPNHYYLVFEFCEKGDLQKYLDQNVDGLLPLQHVKQLIKCIAEALGYLHSRGIAHRDIKLANILLKKDFTIKLADFGFARETSAENLMMKTYCGTPFTMAPEIFLALPYDNKCDIWSLGVILYQLTFKQAPFPLDQGLAGLIDSITNHPIELPSYPHIPASLTQLILACLERDQNKRITIEQFLENSWFKEEDSGEMLEEEVELKHKGSIKDVLKKVALEKKKQSMTEEQFTEVVEHHNIEGLLATRTYNILSAELDCIIQRHMKLRNELAKMIGNQEDLLKLLHYYDFVMLRKFSKKDLKIRTEGQSDILVPFQAFKSVKIPLPLSENIGQEPVYAGVVLVEYLKKLAAQEMELEGRKLRYEIVISFLDFIQNFEIEAVFCFNQESDYELSLPYLAQCLQNSPSQNLSESDFCSTINHISIALECREVDERFRETANTLKSSCQKRIDAIQREIQGY